MPEMEMQTSTIVIYNVPVWLKRLIRAEAGKRDMSMSAFIKQVLTEWSQTLKEEEK